MLAAVKKNDLVAVRRLLAKRPTLAKVREYYHFGGGCHGFLRPLLHIAAIGGGTEMVKLLIDAGADVNEEGERGFPPLFNAVWSGRPDTVGLLIENGAAVNGNWTISPLFIASGAGFADVVALLILARQELNRRIAAHVG